MERVFTQSEAKLYHLAHEVIISVLDSTLSVWTDNNKLDMIRKLSVSAIKRLPTTEDD